MGLEFERVKETRWGSEPEVTRFPQVVQRLRRKTSDPECGAESSRNHNFSLPGDVRVPQKPISRGDVHRPSPGA